MLMLYPDHFPVAGSRTAIGAVSAKQACSEPRSLICLMVSDAATGAAATATERTTANSARTLLSISTPPSLAAPTRLFCSDVSRNSILSSISRVAGTQAQRENHCKVGKRYSSEEFDIAERLRAESV